MKKANPRTIIALLFALMASVGGCSAFSPQPDRSRFFVLAPSPDLRGGASAAGVGKSSDFTVGLGPITIPRYLQRPEIVTRISKTEMAVSDNDRWAEPLETCVASVLAQDLSMDLPGVQIVPFPWSEKSRSSYSVSVEFLHLETTATGRAEVEATWRIIGPDNKPVQVNTTTADLSAGNDQTMATAALSEGIGQIGREIAEALAQQNQIAAKKSNPRHS